jgi:hypothetical protein
MVVTGVFDFGVGCRTTVMVCLAPWAPGEPRKLYAYGEWCRAIEALHRHAKVMGYVPSFLSYIERKDSI